MLCRVSREHGVATTHDASRAPSRHEAQSNTSAGVIEVHLRPRTHSHTKKRERKKKKSRDVSSLYKKREPCRALFRWVTLFQPPRYIVPDDQRSKFASSGRGSCPEMRACGFAEKKNKSRPSLDKEPADDVCCMHHVTARCVGTSLSLDKRVPLSRSVPVALQCEQGSNTCTLRHIGRVTGCCLSRGLSCRHLSSRTGNMATSCVSSFFPIHFPDLSMPYSSSFKL